MSETNKLEVRIDDRETQRDQLLEDIRSMERGEHVDEKHVLVLENEAELHRLLSPANLELLRAIRTQEPKSMRAVAEAVDRDFKEVHRNLRELAALNVVELEDEGRSKRPVVRFNEIDIQLSLDPAETDNATA